MTGLRHLVFGVLILGTVLRLPDVHPLAAESYDLRAT